MSSDITHCYGQGCPLQDSCLRCTQKVFGRQDAFTRLPYDFATEHCDYYWNERPIEERIRERAYQLWLEHGCPENSGTRFWFAAREQLIERLRLGR